MAWRNAHLGAGTTWTARGNERASASRLSRVLSAVWRLFSSVKVHRRERSLVLHESLSLGDRRLLALVECEGQRLLVGVTNQSVTLLHSYPRASRETN